MDPAKEAQKIRKRFQERDQRTLADYEAKRLQTRQEFVKGFYTPRPSRIGKILLEEQAAFTARLVAE